MLMVGDFSQTFINISSIIYLLSGRWKITAAVVPCPKTEEFDPCAKHGGRMLTMDSPRPVPPEALSGFCPRGKSVQIHAFEIALRDAYAGILYLKAYILPGIAYI